MQKLKLLSCFCLFFAAAKAQPTAWYPVQPGMQHNYKVDTAALPFSVAIKIDSSLGTTYHLNKIVSSCDTCVNGSLLNDPWDTTYVLTHQPQFLGHSFSKTNTNVFYIAGPSSFTLNPYAAIGASWLFDSVQAITATLVAKNVQPILGLSDSVAVMKLSTNDTVVLSKNYGVVQFPFKTLATHYYRLAGLEGTATAGVKLKRFHDFFDFNVGDVFQYAFRDDDYNNFPPSFSAGAERWDILAVTLYNDSVHYKIRQTYADSILFFGGTPVLTAYTTTLTISFVDSLKHLANAYPLQEITTNPYFIFDNGLRYIHTVTMGLDNRSKITKSFGQNCPDEFLDPGITGAAVETPFTNVFLNRNSSRITGRQVAEGLGFISELFNNYDRIVQRCLIGYIKGTDTSGTIYSNGLEALGFKTNALPQNHFVLYPVPANDKINIKGPVDAALNISLVNAMGETLQTILPAKGQPATTISTAGLANGIYFIVISTRTTSEIKKLIIQH